MFDILEEDKGLVWRIIFVPKSLDGVLNEGEQLDPFAVSFERDSMLYITIRSLLASGGSKTK